MRSIVISLTMLSTLTACGSPPPDDAVDGPDTTDRVVDTLEERRDVAAPGSGEPSSGGLGVEIEVLLDGAFVRDPDTEDLPILDRLGDPTRISIDTLSNRHIPGQTDTLRTLHYDDVAVTIHLAGGKEILENITVIGESIPSPEGLSVGMSRSDVVNVLGEPLREENGAYIYEQNGPMPTRQIIRFDNDEVTRIEWRLPAD